MSLGGLIAISLALGLLAWLGFLWSVKSGQYEDPEGPKYRMLDDEEEARPPAPGGGPAAADAKEGDDPPRSTGQGPVGGQPPGRS